MALVLCDHGGVLTNPYFTCTDTGELYRLIDENPWATLVASTSDGLRASHYPVIRDGDELLTHVGKQDERILELGSGDLLVIVQGAHGYIPSRWLPEGEFVPTWNHVTAHLTCSVEVLSPEDNFAALCELVRRCEGARPARPLEDYGDEAWRAARGSLGLRLRVRSFTMIRKLSQNKPLDVVQNLVSELRQHPHDRHGLLAAEMERAAASRDGLAERFRDAVTSALREARTTGYRPARFMRNLVTEGAVAAAKRHLSDPATAAELDALIPAEQLGDSVEATVSLPWFAALFSEDELGEARERLASRGFDPELLAANPPPWARN